MKSLAVVVDRSFLVGGWEEHRTFEVDVVGQVERKTQEVEPHAPVDLGWVASFAEEIVKAGLMVGVVVAEGRKIVMLVVVVLMVEVASWVGTAVVATDVVVVVVTSAEVVKVADVAMEVLGKMGVEKAVDCLVDQIYSLNLLRQIAVLEKMY